MTYGSVCSGIEAATVAWEPLGWKPAWFAEIDPFCCALLRHHYPKVKNYGDFTKIQADSGPIDLLVGGTPCQSFSVAGKRAGLDDARGNLTLEFLKVAGRLRPQWVVWENVPGVLPIDKGRTFGTFLGILGQLGYGFAYRVLDAQYFGVPQRRRRVFVVGHLGNWRRAAAVLFERHILSGNPAPSRKAGQRTVPTLEGRAGTSGANNFATSGGVIHTVEVRDGGCVDLSPTIDVRCEYGPRRNQGGIGIILFGKAAVPATQQNAESEGGAGRGTPECANVGTLRSASGGSSRPYIAGTLAASGAGSARPAGNANETDLVIPCGMAVRRLTPREAERLQGFKDDYTLIPYRGKPAADGPRYRAIGNSMAVPVMRWIGERIEQVEAIVKSNDWTLAPPSS